jgi:CRP-like cAMP-binding protein
MYPWPRRRSLTSAVNQSGSGILRVVDANDLQRLQELGSESELPAGRVLIERGQWGSGVYVILEGTVVVEAPEGERELGPGSVVGERAMFSEDGLRTARVQATSPVRVVAVDRTAFDRLCADDPALAERLAPPG